MCITKTSCKCLYSEHGACSKTKTLELPQWQVLQLTLFLTRPLAAFNCPSNKCIFPANKILEITMCRDSIINVILYHYVSPDFLAIHTLPGWEDLQTRSHRFLVCRILLFIIHTINLTNYSNRVNKLLYIYLAPISPSPQF